MRLELHPEARAELRSAALWYDERRPGLGDEFIAEVAAAFDRIGAAPESYPAWPGTRAAGPLIRKATVQRFPYLIAFDRPARAAGTFDSPFPNRPSLSPPPTALLADEPRLRVDVQAIDGKLGEAVRAQVRVHQTVLTDVAVGLDLPQDVIPDVARQSNVPGTSAAMARPVRNQGLVVLVRKMD